jgi:uncharacterized protein YdeI (YjbR/CyaY-like superfamily)
VDDFTDVDAYVGASELWPDEIAALRPILLGAGLTEQIKWGKPCYSHDGGNVVIVQEMKDFLALMFFKGALLEDPAGVLVDQGPNSRSARRIELTSIDEVARLADTIAGCLGAAIAVEEAGLEVGPAPEPELADELRARLDGDSALEAAFEALTPGRRREYNLHISGAKQSSTRESRIDRCVPKILDGKGLRDR